MTEKLKVSVIGSGNWGSTIGKIVGLNCLSLKEFEDEVKMWVFEEIINGEKLTNIINTKHENIKYLPSITLPPNLKAESSIVECVKDADILLFVIPHQFLRRACDDIKSHIKPNAFGCSLIKGLDENEAGTVRLLTDVIREKLNIECAVMMGANLASEVAEENFCEATVASNDKYKGNLLKSIFQTPYFRITVTSDEVGTELCGALKNIIAIGAGLSDGLGYGDNTKAAIIRLGFMEMIQFIMEFFKDRNPQSSTFLESCGVADLITTCYGGRNRRVGIALTKSTKPVSEIEAELLGGQSAQGVLTADAVFSMLHRVKLQGKYPMFSIIHYICQRKRPASDFLKSVQAHIEHV